MIADINASLLAVDGAITLHLGAKAVPSKLAEFLVVIYAERRKQKLLPIGRREDKGEQ